MVKNGASKQPIRHSLVGKKLNPQPPSANSISVVGQIGNSIVGVGGTSICRAGDLQPLSIIPTVVPFSEFGECSKTGAGAYNEAAGNDKNTTAQKLFDKMPETPLGKEPGQPANLLPISCGLIMTETDSEFEHLQLPKRAEILQQPPKLSYAAAVRKMPASYVNSKAKGPAGHQIPINDERSFHDYGEPTAFGQILEKNGRKMISFSAQELAELVAPFKYTLVGKFSHGFPSMKTLRSIMGNLKLKGDFSVSLLEERHVLIRLCCEEDFSRLWCRQVWFMAGFQMRVYKWTPDFCPQVEAPYAPVWVIFPYLPVHLFDKRSLFIIASTLGKPLRIDSATAELSRASTPRVCVEVNLSQTLLQEVEINLDGKTLIQRVEYENIPKYCSSCKHFGHDMAVCKSVKNPSAQAGTILRSPNHPEVNAAANQHSSPVQSVQQPAPARFDLDDLISLDSKGIISFTPGPNNPTTKPLNVSKIRDDILQSYDRLDNVSDVDSDRNTILEGEFFNPYARVRKTYYSEDDWPDSESEPIVLPPKKIVQKKVKSNTVKTKKVEDRVGTDPVEIDIAVEQRNTVIDHDLEMGFETVTSKKKLKEDKARKKQESGS